MDKNRKQAIQHNAETNDMWNFATEKYREDTSRFFVEFVMAAKLLKEKKLAAAGLVLSVGMAKFHTDKEMDDTAD
ncbi:hypothetical protein LCGC14_2422710 [marine sediment metagenome]|uniref:Uncharacterized protein n=1 Tax=marine sediment metagenome TaxID=412755 RepID=A0A0F9E1D0_9ZZZZ